MNASELPRMRVPLDYDWRFVRRRMPAKWIAGTAGPDGETVTLPHCWNDRDGFTPGVAYYRGPGSYRRVFKLPPQTREAGNKGWQLESEGFYGTGEVWLNGKRIAEIDGQYLGFSLDVSRDVRPESENLLAIRLTNKCSSHVLPGIKMPDFLLHGGLAGRVWLETAPSLRLDAKRLAITTSDVLSRAPAVRIELAVVNRSTRHRRAKVVWGMEKADGTAAAVPAESKIELGPNADSGPLSATLLVPDAALWSPDSPNLYAAVCSVIENGVTVDRVRQQFGIRHAEFIPDAGFFLNGSRLELRGCNRHESMPGFGSALPEGLHRADARQLKELGCNFVRLSHCPQHPCFLDACDELGLLVYAEIATWKSVRAGRWLKSACRQMQDMIARDRNRPSVVLWGMGNESRSSEAYVKLRGIARQMDAARPVIYAENHMYRAVRKKTTGIPDVWGCNYELDALEQGRDASRMRCVVVSEYANWPEAERGNLEEELKQVRLIEREWARIEGRPYVAGHALWCFNDYGTLRKNRYRRRSGLVDAWRLPKMAAALWRAKYSNAPFVKLFGDWKEREGGAGQSREIHVFSNCAKVVLRINGREIAALDGGPHLVQTVEFEPGTLTAAGEGMNGPATDTLESHGAAHGISVVPDKPESDAGARETVGFTVQVLDDRGRVALDWNGEAKAGLEGPAFLRAYSTESVIQMGAGVGRCFLTATGAEGVATIRVFASGLQSGECAVRCVGRQ